jgi:hypothetical protein
MAEAKRTLFGIFELAAETFRVDANPVHQWREALPKNKTQHKRALTSTEIGQLRRGVDGHRFIQADAEYLGVVRQVQPACHTDNRQHPPQ